MVSKAAMQYHKRADWRTFFGVCCQTGDHVVFFWIATAGVSRASPVHTGMRNCMRDEGGPFETGSQVQVSSHRKLLPSKAVVVSVAETPGL